MDGKPLLWAGSSRKDLRDLAPAVRKELGTDLRRVQSGLAPRDWKPMSAVGAGVVAKITE